MRIARSAAGFRTIKAQMGVTDSPLLVKVESATVDHSPSVCCSADLPLFANGGNVASCLIPNIRRDLDRNTEVGE